VALELASPLGACSWMLYAAMNCALVVDFLLTGLTGLYRLRVKNYVSCALFPGSAGILPAFGNETSDP